MKLRTYITVGIVALLCACGKKSEALYEHRPFTVLTDSIYTVMPGNMLLSPKYLVWIEPFSDSTFLHVHDTVSGKELVTIGSIGQGPNEFVTPSMSQFAVNNEVFVSDVNGNNQGFFLIDSLLCGKNYYCRQEKDSTMDSFSRIADNFLISNTQDGEESYFQAMMNNRSVKFGSYPIPEYKQHIWGNMAYDPRSRSLIYAPLDFPYMACYQYDEVSGNFELKKERKSNIDNYRMENGYLQFDWKKAKGASELCLSRDYIITLERDRTRDKTDETAVGRDASLRPTTVFLYDYELNLKRIVDLSAPILRICSDITRNTLYAIVVVPDYTLVKCEL